MKDECGGKYTHDTLEERCGCLECWDFKTRPCQRERTLYNNTVY